MLIRKKNLLKDWRMLQSTKPKRREKGLPGGGGGGGGPL